MNRDRVESELVQKVEFEKIESGRQKNGEVKKKKIKRLGTMYKRYGCCQNNLFEIQYLEGHVGMGVLERKLKNCMMG